VVRRVYRLADEQLGAPHGPRGIRRGGRRLLRPRGGRAAPLPPRQRDAGASRPGGVRRPGAGWTRGRRARPTTRRPTARCG
jgi:hypothetical protein